MYKLCFYVPESHLEGVKNACFTQGAGRIGNYRCCAWQVLGQGQFMPMTGSKPYLGAENQIERANEYCVEMVCTDELIHDVIAALKDAHPYEEPAYQAWRIETF